MARMDVATVAAVVISALSALGCSDPPEPPARGGLLLIPDGTDRVGETCPAAHSLGVGNPTPTAEDPSVNGLKISGEDDTDVTCTVSKNGEFRASIAAPNVSLDLRGTLGQPGSISAYAPSATLSVIGVNICTFSTEPPYSYHPGEMFIGFSCPGAKNPDYPGTVCNMSGSVVVLRCAE